MIDEYLTYTIVCKDCKESFSAKARAGLSTQELCEVLLVQRCGCQELLNAAAHSRPNG